MANAVSASQINLTWTDRSDQEYGFIVERKTSSGGFSEIASLEPDTTAFADTGLLSGVTYSYRVKAYYSEGESGYSNVVSLSAGEAVPEAPGGLTAKVVTPSRIDLTWTDRSHNEKGFKIERKTSGGFYSQIAVVGANATTYTSSGLGAGTRYEYRVCAYNDAGDSGYSNEAGAVTGEAMPDAPGGLTSKAVTSSRIDLTWTDRSDNEKGFKIERKTSGGFYSQIAVVGANATTYTSSGLDAGTRYDYRVRAYNDAGDSAYSNEAGAVTGEDTTVPSKPVDLEAVSTSTSKIKLTWEDRSDNEDGFKIERKKSGGSYSQITTVGRSVTSYTDSGLADDTRYYYRIRAYNGAGNSAYSNEVSAVTGEDTTVPSKPVDLEAVSTSTSKIKLTWEDRSDDEDGFKIERKKSGGSYSQITTVGRSVTSYTDSGLADDTRYYYRIRAYNGAGNSAYSNEVSAVTGDDTTVPSKPVDLEAVSTTTSKIKLTWEDRSDDEDGFKIERKKSGGIYSQITTVGRSVTSYTDSGLADDTRYYYRIRAYNDAGNSAYSNEVSAVTGEDNTVPSKPVDLEAVSTTTSKIKLTWEDRSDNEDGFKIERKKSGGIYSQIATVGRSVTSYTDSGLADDTRYYYRIRAYNGAGNSAYSNEASTTSDKEKTIIKLIIGDPSYYVNNKVKTMDTAPFIMGDRTLLPIRYVAEELDAKVDWDNRERKVTIAIEGTKIELWIERSYAMVNGLQRAIDKDNQNVKPIIVSPGRTMLPLRFIAENLGCRVDWEPGRSEVTVTYPEP
jgi:titin